MALDYPDSTYCGIIQVVLYHVPKEIRSIEEHLRSRCCLRAAYCLKVPGVVTLAHPISGMHRLLFGVLFLSSLFMLPPILS